MAQKNILKYIILGLLNHKELAGYDLKKLFEGEVGDFWSSNHSQIYPELRRMEEKGLITSHSETVGTKLEKKYYHITPAGQEILSSWMHEPLSSLVPSRDEFTMKLYLIDDPRDPAFPGRNCPSSEKVRLSAFPLGSPVPHTGRPAKAFRPFPHPGTGYRTGKAAAAMAC